MAAAAPRRLSHRCAEKKFLYAAAGADNGKVHTDAAAMEMGKRKAADRTSAMARRKIGCYCTFYDPLVGARAIAQRVISLKARIISDKKVGPIAQSPLTAWEKTVLIFRRNRLRSGFSKSKKL